MVCSVSERQASGDGDGIRIEGGAPYIKSLFITLPMLFEYIWTLDLSRWEFFGRIVVDVPFLSND